MLHVGAFTSLSSPAKGKMRHGSARRQDRKQAALTQRTCKRLFSLQTLLGSSCVFCDLPRSKRLGGPTGLWSCCQGGGHHQHLHGVVRRRFCSAGNPRADGGSEQLKGLAWLCSPAPSWGSGGTRSHLQSVVSGKQGQGGPLLWAGW